MTKQSADPASHDKPCTLCQTPRSVLIRCQIDETGKWHFVCPGKCWKSVSGGEIDAKGHESDFPFYRYGGMWKNRHADGPLNAKKPKKKKNKKNAGGEGQSDDEGSDTAEEKQVQTAGVDAASERRVDEQEIVVVSQSQQP